MEQARRARRIDGRAKNRGEVAVETACAGGQFTLFGLDHADRFVTTSNCLSRWTINWSASLALQT